LQQQALLSTREGQTKKQMAAAARRAQERRVAEKKALGQGEAVQRAKGKTRVVI
jgi:hypothetical protein